VSAKQGDRARSILASVYTLQQAERSLHAYAEHCSRCHRDDLRGNPEARR
jgi:hypothetical protein